MNALSSLRHGHAHGRRRQTGVSLIISLVFLLAMSLLGVAAVMSTTTQERMARVDRDHTIALEAAETALRDAELDIRLSLSSTPPKVGSATRLISANPAVGTMNFSCACGSDLGSKVQYGLCLPLTNAACSAQTKNPWDVQSNWTGNGSVPVHTYTSAAGTTNVPLSSVLLTALNYAANGSSQLPRYMIEIIPNTDNTNCSARVNVTCVTSRYRLTARGWGPNGNYAMVQETFQP